MDAAAALISWRWIGNPYTQRPAIQQVVKTNPSTTLTTLTNNILNGIETPSFPTARKFTRAVQGIYLNHEQVERLAEALKKRNIFYVKTANRFCYLQHKEIEGLDMLVTSNDVGAIVSKFSIIKGAVKLPEPENRNALFKILCKQVKPRDVTLYSAIGRLINQHLLNLNSQEESPSIIQGEWLDEFSYRTAFDDFMENGGYFDKLVFRYLTTNITRCPYAYNRIRDFTHISPEDLFIAIIFPSLRPRLFATPNFPERLNGNLLKALIHLADWEINRDITLEREIPKSENASERFKDHHKKAWLPLFKKLPDAAQREFLERMSPDSSKAFSTFYQEQEHVHLNAIKQNLINKVYGLLYSINPTQDDWIELTRLADLVAPISPSQNEDKSLGTPLVFPPDRNRITFVILRVSEILNLIQILSLWMDPEKVKPVTNHLRKMLRETTALKDAVPEDTSELTALEREVDWHHWHDARIKSDVFLEHLKRCPNPKRLNIHSFDVEIELLIEAVFRACEIPDQCDDDQLGVIFRARMNQLIPPDTTLEDAVQICKSFCPEDSDSTEEHQRKRSRWTLAKLA